jgi:hypothetical protein
MQQVVKFNSETGAQGNTDMDSFSPTVHTGLR